jgi:hypothetical protein
MIKCTAAAGLANSKARANALWLKLKPLLKAGAGKFAAVQARELWSKEERVHLRPGHFWACELGDADGKGSPILHTFTKKNEYFTLSNGVKMRGDEGNCLLLIRRYYHRTADDRDGLTFMREQRGGELLAVNSSELRAVAGHQANDFVLTPINGPKLREKHGRAKKGAVVHEVAYPPKQRWALDEEVDCDTRGVCEGT